MGRATVQKTHLGHLILGSFFLEEFDAAKVVSQSTWEYEKGKAWFRNRIYPNENDLQGHYSTYCNNWTIAVLLPLNFWDILGMLHLTWHLEHMERKILISAAFPNFIQKHISFQSAWCQSGKICEILKDKIAFATLGLRINKVDREYGVFF